MPTMTGIIAMRAQVSAIGTLNASGGLFGGLAMQLRVDLLRELTRNAFDVRNVVDRRRRQPAHAAKSRQQALAPFRADAVHRFEFRRFARLGAARPHAGNGEAMR